MKSREVLPLCLPLLASVAFAGPIRVSGDGTFVADPVTSDSSFTISFSGSNGVDSISLRADCGGGGWGGSGVSALPGHCDGFAIIDGLDFSSGSKVNETFSFVVANGSGFARGENLDLGQFAFVSLIGWVSVTSESCVGSEPSRVCRGRFAVIATPEPGSIAFGLLGLSAIAVRIAKKRIRTGSSHVI